MSVNFNGTILTVGEIEISGSYILPYSTGVVVNIPDLNAPNSVSNIGSLTGIVTIDYDPSQKIQLASMSGVATTLNKGSGWPDDVNYSVDSMLKISVSSGTSVVWNIVDQWYSQPPSGPLVSGVHLVLLREVGTTIEGHYIGIKTN